MKCLLCGALQESCPKKNSLSPNQNFGKRSQYPFDSRFRLEEKTQEGIVGLRTHDYSIAKMLKPKAYIFRLQGLKNEADTFCKAASDHSRLLGNDLEQQSSTVFGHETEELVLLVNEYTNNLILPPPTPLLEH